MKNVWILVLVLALAGCNFDEYLPDARSAIVVSPIGSDIVAIGVYSVRVVAYGDTEIILTGADIDGSTHILIHERGDYWYQMNVTGPCECSMIVDDIKYCSEVI